MPPLGCDSVQVRIMLHLVGRVQHSRHCCRDREVREDRKRVLGAVGMGHLASLESESDNASTNLYVTNLYRTVTEDVLMDTFGRYGPLASVKIMWPRLEEERGVKTHNSGFVAFMVRAATESSAAHLANVSVASCLCSSPALYCRLGNMQRRQWSICMDPCCTDMS
jgi:RNA recognition motif. (a.k.a. RRM, RBD, or RNP domain)